jgi:predicted RNA-binding Zn ribbon-like protein
VKRRTVETSRLSKRGTVETMVTTGQAAPRELPIVGGHLALDFANTVDNPLGPVPHDHLAGYGDLLAWSVRLAVVSEEQAAVLRRRAARRRADAAAALHRAHELRDALNDVFGGVADGAGDLAARWPRLRPFVADAIVVAALQAGTEPPRWAWPQSDDLAVALHAVAVAAVELLRSNDLPRIKRCAGCPWLFLDQSKNHSRRWCDMADCGTAWKMRRYVERRSIARRRAG